MAIITGKATLKFGSKNKKQISDDYQWVYFSSSCLFLIECVFTCLFCISVMTYWLHFEDNMIVEACCHGTSVSEYLDILNLLTFRFVFEDQIEFIKDSVMDGDEVYILNSLITVYQYHVLFICLFFFQLWCMGWLNLLVPQLMSPLFLKFNKCSLMMSKLQSPWRSLRQNRHWRSFRLVYFSTLLSVC